MRRKIAFLLLFFPLLTHADNLLPVMVYGLEKTPAAEKNVETRLKTLQSDLPLNLNAEQIHAFYRQAPGQIRLALQPFGYFMPRITPHLIQQTGHWTMYFTIQPGTPLRIEQVTVKLQGEGKANAGLQKFVQNFPLQSGQPLNIPAYTDAKRDLLNAALQAGYLNAHFNQQQIRISLRHYQAKIILVLDTGQRFYFGPTHFTTTALSPDFLQRFIPYQPGEAFSSQKLTRFQTVLRESGYFSTLRVTPNLTAPNAQHVPIQVNLSLRKKQKLTAGIGYGTDTGPRLSLGSHWRYLNAEGHSANIQTTFSSVQSIAMASYIIPGRNPATDQYSFNSSLIATHLNQGTSRTEMLGVSAIKQLTHAWQRTYSLNYQIEQFKFDNQPGQTSHLLIPGARWIYLRSNNKTFPTQGNRFLISTQGSLQCGISDNRFGQFEIQDKYITHFTHHDRILLRGDWGYSAIHDLPTFPLSQRFYAGGSQSVRGFSYQSLGPGRYLLTASAEFQQEIYPNWYGAIFYDTGNAMNQWQGPLPYSSGIGIVWASPIGSMELTLAKAWSLPDHPLRVQFVIGPDL